MSRKALRKAWSFCGLLAFAFAGFALLRTTGSSAPDSILPLASYGPYGVTLLAIPLGSALTLATLWLTRRHAERVEGEGLPLHGANGRWAARLPVFYFDPDDIDPWTRDGRRYQGLFLAGFILWPVVAQVLLFAKLWRGRVSVGAGLVSGWGHLFPRRDIDCSAWLDGSYHLDGLSYYPGLQPWTYLLLVLWVVWSCGVTLHHLTRSRPAPPRQAGDDGEVNAP